MIIECPSCRSKYQYDEERFERKPTKKIKCAKCQQIFEIHNPAFAPKPAAASGDNTASRQAERQDDTRAARKLKMPAQDTTEQSAIPKPPVAGLALPTGKRLSLAILEGSDAGSVYRIDKPRVTIGRSNADLTINDTEASRQHAALEIRDTTCTLHDLGSTNGTLVDGRRIDGPVELTDKGEFVIGGTMLMLIVTDDQ